MIIFFLAVIYGFSQSESFREFVHHGNGIPEYALVHQTDCKEGLRRSGFSFTPTDTVVFKQRNPDGSFGSICK